MSMGKSQAALIHYPNLGCDDEISCQPSFSPAGTTNPPPPPSIGPPGPSPFSGSFDSPLASAGQGIRSHRSHLVSQPTTLRADQAALASALLDDMNNE
ncbi:hypothetical protein AJ80_09395 [Polytolypa hystricis UAMH7299]|uniref:Uncharacterized protein n=1 Tax=Polytolypa hystricis (strain UAMH7299) TaxID=1447883 RepID=A0A2B7WRM3_POLH7|nr:hypothetical protein AJ80_09395 [Polytolypa hystricis UAMH7299]